METAEALERDEFDADDEEDVDANISHLNDDILLHIFMFLTIKDRVKIERGI
jgi:hypothetical protein